MTTNTVAIQASTTAASGAPSTVTATAGAIATRMTPITARVVSAAAPSSAGTRPRTAVQASPIDSRCPITARLTTTVSRPVRTSCTSSVSTVDSAVIASIPRFCRSPPGAPANPGEVDIWSNSDIVPRSESHCSESHCSGSCSSVTAASTIADSPSIARGCARIAVIAPSRISVSPSGRSGTIPGLGACGSHPGPDAPHPCPAGRGPPGGAVRSYVGGGVP